MATEKTISHALKKGDALRAPAEPAFFQAYQRTLLSEAISRKDYEKAESIARGTRFGEVGTQAVDFLASSGQWLRVIGLGERATLGDVKKYASGKAREGMADAVGRNYANTALIIALGSEELASFGVGEAVRADNWPIACKLGLTGWESAGMRALEEGEAAGNLEVIEFFAGNARHPKVREAAQRMRAGMEDAKWAP